LIAAAAICLPLLVGGQTLTLTNGVQQYGSLTNAAVTMSGNCQLWVTGGPTPLTSCQIGLNSPDAWLFLPGIPPSTVATTCLGQVKVSGAPAISGSNVRVVQYGQNGAVVIPQAPSFQPLTTFPGPQFSGTPTRFSQSSYYTGTGVTNISSFKLKRGYQAVLAQSANGLNYSRCYTASDGDLEVGVMPATLDKQVQFIYVTPWRWVSKKGIAGNPGIGWLNVNWWYDWNLDQSSSPNLEYAAIRQNQYWPGLAQNWGALGINTLLGYNEPDQSSQANMSVATAISAWGDLLGTGLRVGSPATSDGGRSGWLYPFVQQADAAGLRVDFVAIHYYWSHDPTDPAGCASQMYSFLLDIWNNAQRPIWITEWNNGANWTDSQWPVPTFAQQQACIAAMTQMLETTPFVERYALYNWVEDGRSLVTSSNTVTPAGTTYSNLVSSIGYTQAMPNNGTRSIAEFRFATNAWDSSGYYNNGMAVGSPGYATGHAGQSQAIALDGSHSYVQLPANIAQAGAFTFAAWVYWNGGNQWQRIFDFGNDTSHYLYLSPDSGSTTLRFTINNGSGEQTVERPGALATGSWQHVAVTLNGANATLFLNGAQVAVSTSFSIAPSAFNPARNYLGKSQFPADPLFNGRLEAVEIADYAMTAAQIASLYNSTAYPALTGGQWTNDASGVWSAAANWNGGVVANSNAVMADFSQAPITASRSVTVDTPRTIGGLRFGCPSGALNWFLAGTSPLTLDGGGGNTPLVAVNQNSAIITAPLLGTAGLSKTGAGTLILDSANSLGGGLTVNAGAVNVTGGVTTFGTGTSSIGYLTGSGALNVSAGTLALAGELRVGGSDQNGSQYTATGTATVAGATLAVGSLTVARGNYLDNTISGTLTLNSGATLISTNDTVIQFAGLGHGTLAINGGNFILGPSATKWLMVGYWDSGAGEVDLTSGNLELDNSTSIKMCRSGNTGGNAFNQSGGTVTFYADAGLTPGGGGNLDLNYGGGTSSTSTYNLNGGTLTVPQIIATSTSGSGIFNFNGGTLRPTGANPAFMTGLTRANIRNNGAVVSTLGYNLTIGQPLLHSAIAGDNPADGGLSKTSGGTLTLSSPATYTGPTTVTGGTLALTGSGAISQSSAIAVAAGAVLDVSAVNFSLGAAQTLQGGGTVRGAATINGTLAPGPSLATLTFSLPPKLNGTTLLKLNRAAAPDSDALAITSGTLVYGGALVVTNAGAPLQGGDAFSLFQAGALGGAFASLSLPPLGPNLAWNTNRLAAGWLSVLSTASTNLTWSLNGTNLILSWPADHLGWRVQVQTNTLATGLGPNWSDLPGASLTDSLTLPLAPANGCVFYRLIFP